MKQGTVSVLVGCHSLVHSIMVVIAWKKLYGRSPNLWQLVCIFLHDLGHWGKDYLDDYEEKKKHSLLGAKIARFLFGRRGYDLVIGHNLYNSSPKSVLHDPDKYSWVISPTWWLVSNTYFEPKLIRRGKSRKESAIMFREAMRENVEKGSPKMGHEIYLEQWGTSKYIKEDTQ